jgi:hypothetical protein
MEPKKEDASPPTRNQALRSSSNDDEDIARMLRYIRNDREGTFPPIVRYLGYGLGFFTLIALGVLTIVMVRDVSFSTQIYGSPTLVSGQMATYRLAFFDPENTGFLQGVEASIWLLDKEKRVLLFQGKSVQDALNANFRVPSLPAGRYRLLVEAQGIRGAESFVRDITVTSPSQAQGTYGKESGQRVWTTVEEEKSPYRARFFAEGRAFVSDLPNRVYAWIQERVPEAPSTQPSGAMPSSTQPSGAMPPSTQPSGAASQPSPPKARTEPPRPPSPSFPLFASPDGKEKRGLMDPFAKPKQPKESKRWERWRNPIHPVVLSIKEERQNLDSYATDTAGVVRFSYVPQFFHLTWELSMWGRRGHLKQVIQMKTEGYQVIADPTRIFFPQGGEIAFWVESLSRTNPLHIDLVQDGQRLWSTRQPLKEGRTLVKIKPPKAIRGLVTLQIYTEFFFPGEVYDARLLYIGEPTGKTIRESLRKHLIRRGDGLRVLEMEAFAPPPEKATELERWARVLFAFAKARFTPPSLLYDSSKARLTHLRRYQHDFRRRTIMMLGGLGGVVLLGVFLWMFAGYRRDRMRMLAHAQEEDIQIKTRGGYLIVVALLVIGLIFASVLYLFWAIQWKYDGF